MATETTHLWERTVLRIEARGLNGGASVELDRCQLICQITRRQQMAAAGGFATLDTQTHGRTSNKSTLDKARHRSWKYERMLHKLRRKISQRSLTAVRFDIVNRR